MNGFAAAQAAYENVEAPEYYESDDFFTEDEIEDAKLELQLERLEAIEQGQWFTD